LSAPDVAAKRGAATLLVVYGPPAAGKLTIAQAVAERTGFRLFHNHLAVDAVASVLTWGTPRFFELVNRFRLELVDAAAAEHVDVVFTFAYAWPEDDAFVAGLVDAVARRDGRVLFVQLKAPQDELLRRVMNPSRRAFGKIDDEGVLRDVLARYDFSRSVPFEPNLIVDTAALTPEAAAVEISAHYGLNGS
jgi:chloramphenicol 3-O-phosphotransferase